MKAKIATAANIVVILVAVVVGSVFLHSRNMDSALPIQAELRNRGREFRPESPGGRS